MISIDKIEKLMGLSFFTHFYFVVVVVICVDWLPGKINLIATCWLNWIQRNATRKHRREYGGEIERVRIVSWNEKKKSKKIKCKLITFDWKCDLDRNMQQRSFHMQLQRSDEHTCKAKPSKKQLIFNSESQRRRWINYNNNNNKIRNITNTKKSEKAQIQSFHIRLRRIIIWLKKKTNDQWSHLQFHVKCIDSHLSNDKLFKTHFELISMRQTEMNL